MCDDTPTPQRRNNPSPFLRLSPRMLTVPPFTPFDHEYSNRFPAYLTLSNEFTVPSLVHFTPLLPSPTITTTTTTLAPPNEQYGTRTEWGVHKHILYVYTHAHIERRTRQQSRTAEPPVPHQFYVRDILHCVHGTFREGLARHGHASNCTTLRRNYALPLH